MFVTLDEITAHVTLNGADRAPPLVLLHSLGTVTRVYTDLAVLDVMKTGFRLIDRAPGLSFDDVPAQTGTALEIQPNPND
jgi:acyl CoA:acetate/3-ketoacid CoA transferase beta subunit